MVLISLKSSLCTQDTLWAQNIRNGSGGIEVNREKEEENIKSTFNYLKAAISFRWKCLNVLHT